jgi:S1-C subfamily serine protease
VTLEDGRSFEGSVVWSDVDLDLSIIKISAKDLPAVTLADSNSIRVGESVYAIGNPIGFEFRRTVTSGIISAKNRTIKLEEGENQSYMTDLIQTDATINPGNSGGPLIYPNGEVIGINTVKISSAEGIGFAVPINVVKQVIKSFDETDNFDEPTIGIFAYDKEVIPYLTSIDPNFNKGIYVARIIANGPASKTELKEGDIIISFDGREINTMNELREYIFTKKPEDEVTLKIQRGKINREIKIKLGKK